jgi:hypothetical protein
MHGAIHNGLLRTLFAIIELRNQGLPATPTRVANLTGRTSQSESNNFKMLVSRGLAKNLTGSQGIEPEYQFVSLQEILPIQTFRVNLR